MEAKKRVVLFLILLGSSPAAGQTSTYAAETSLRAALQVGYDQYARPYTPTHIDVVYTIRSLQSLSVADQTLSFTSFPQLTWHDPRLVWNASDYSNLTEIEVNWAWRPLFFIGNSVDEVDVKGATNDDARMVVFSNGTVNWRQMVISVTSCDVDIEFFPYDIQTCDIALGFAWFENDHTINLNLSTTVADTHFYLPNAEWELQATSVAPTTFDVCCPQSKMPFLGVHMQFQRLHAFYLNTFLLPTILLSVLLVWPFYLPTDSGERLGFSLTVLLSYTVVLSITASFLPTTSRQIPQLAMYLLVVLFLCTFAVCNVALNVKIFHMETDVPNWIKIFYRKAKPIVFFECRRSRGKVGTNDKVLRIEVTDLEKNEKPALTPDSGRASHESCRADSEPPTGNADEVTWKAFSELLDRICVVFYGVAVIILDIVLMTYLSVA